MTTRHVRTRQQRLKRIGLALASTAASALLAAAAAGAASAPPQNQTRPSISGPAVAGKVLTAHNGSWSGTQPITFAYQWRRCDSTGVNCTDVVEAGQSARYISTSADVGHRLRVSVTATNADGRSTRDSLPSAVIKSPPANAPVNTSPPTVSGSPVEGNSLTTSDGSWTGAAATTTSYQWQRCDSGGAGCADVLGATSSSYSPTGLDVDHTLRAVVTVSNQYGSASAVSHQTSVIRSASSSQVSLDSNAAIVVYGARVELTGTVGGSTGGDSVTILARPSTARALQALDSVQTRADGSFSDVETPRVHTVYVAKALGQTSDPVAVNVRPRLTLKRLAHHVLRLRVTAATSFRGRYVIAQVWNRRSQVWSSVARVRLTGRIAGPSPTVVTTASFRLGLKPGARIRVQMPLSQTAPAYVSGSSNAVKL